MKIFFLEKGKLKYISICDYFSIDFSEKKIYLKLKGIDSFSVKFEKVKYKKDKVILYCKTVLIDFEYRGQK